MASPFRYLNNSPKAIRLEVLIDVKYQISLCNVEHGAVAGLIFFLTCLPP